MNKDNKHSLDPEELFKRLGDKQANNEEPLDDFEQEALEGFAMLGDEQQARDAYQEVLVRLSKKNTEAKGPERKTRIVWLSAAAFIAVMLIVGIVWLNDQQGAGHKDLAMSQQERKEPIPAAEPLPPAVETEEPVNEPAQIDANAKQKEVSVTSSSLEQDFAKQAPVEQPVFEKTLEDREQADEKPQEKLKEATVANGTFGNANVNANGEANLGYSGFMTPPDARRKSDAPASLAKEDGKILAKSADKAGNYKAKDEEKDQDNKRDSNNETVAGSYNSEADVTAAAPTESETTKNEQELVMTKSEGKKQAERTNNAPATTGAAAGDFKSAKAQEAQNTGRYYAAGEKALKDRLVAGAGSKTLSGAYTVKASAGSDGKLKVTSVSATGGHCSDCAQLIKKILDGMAGWTPSPGFTFNLTF